MRVLVLGAGIAGLAAARAVHARAPDAEVTVLEAAARAGGLIHSERTPVGLIEHGPDSLVTLRPHAMQALRELGLEHEIVRGPSAPGTFVVRDRELLPLPPGLFACSPSAAVALLRSPLFTCRGKLRMLCEPLIPRRLRQDDEALAAFVRRRFGREFLERAVEPLIAGIHGVPAEELSAHAALPHLVALERAHGSIARGMMRTRSSAKPVPPLASLRSGMRALPARMLRQLGGKLRLGVAACTVRRGRGRTFRVLLEDGACADADAVILATPAHVAARLCAELDGSLAHELAGVEHTSFTSVHLAFERAELGRGFVGTGFVVPTREGHALKACTWVSHKWPERSPAQIALVRCFVRAPVASAEEAIQLALRDLAQLADVKARPRFAHVVRRERALPAYRVGHLARMEATEQRAGELGAIALCGNYLRGVGIAECIASGQAAAESVLLRAQRPCSGEH